MEICETDPGPLLRLVGCFPTWAYFLNTSRGLIFSFLIGHRHFFKGQLDAKRSPTSSNDMLRVVIGRELSRVLNAAL